MKILVLGGTVFLGRHLVDAALARGHEVTLFNRGQHNAELYPELEKLRGDRDGDLTALQGRRWDAVLDPSGYVPRIVRASAELLAPNVSHYTFISSLSVYGETHTPGMDESTSLATMDDPTSENVQEHYGALKTLCEQTVESVMPGRALNVRAGLIVGPQDPTDRFTYWPRRVAQGGDVLAPGRPERFVQFIDARDLAEWTLRMVETGGAGAYNATGQHDVTTMADLLRTCKEVSGSDARFVWVEDAFLTEQGAGAWMELPLWIPESDGAMTGFLRCSSDKAIRDGLRFRPLAETVRDTLAWDRSRPADTEHRAGMKPERECRTHPRPRCHSSFGRGLPCATSASTSRVNSTAFMASRRRSAAVGWGKSRIPPWRASTLHRAVHRSHAP
jgi:2'-hydroxyisoflavone reductase